ncbi:MULTISPECIES: F0F1 ATP synthase subunit C [unclassified Haladaptatus]|uniref:F0F1 ATP synthase subunit C n=1 Tax=unclassified Haladaptatus TaxID=2622732 RepID=UPI0023E85EBF|nr:MULTISPECIES: F0F1 ATP synthase subunit C [unclassified Haladaptatus]
MFETIMTLMSVVLQEGSTEAVAAIPPTAAAALAVGLAAFGAGYAERGIGAAAVGAIAEDDEMFGRGLILTVLPETLVILALVVVFVV